MTTQPESTPPIAGANDLQHSIDTLDRSMNELVTAIRGMTNGNGTTTTPSSATQAGGATFTTGTQGANNIVGGGWGAGSGQTGNGAGIANGSGGTSGANPFSMAGGSGGIGISGAVGGLMSSALGSAAGAVGNYLLNAGPNQLNNQAQINTYGYVQASFYGGSPAPGSAAYQSAIGTAFGSAGKGGIYGQNNAALNATDARFGASILSSVVGSSNYVNGTPGIGYGTTAAGNGGMTSPYLNAASFAMANPGLGMESSAQLTQSVMSPLSSYNLRMMGVGTTPLQYGTGQANNPASVLQSIGTRFGFQGLNSASGTFDSKSLAANLNSPLFQYQMQQAMGMTPTQYQEWANSWTQQNTAVSNFNSQGGSQITMQQMQQQVGQYVNGTGSQQKSAQAWLTSHGVSQSMLQSLTQTNAGQTATQSGANADFVTALQATTKAIQDLTNLLSPVLTSAPVASAAGGTAAVSNAAASGISGALGGGAAATALGGIIGALGGGSGAVPGPAVGSTVGGKGAKGATVAAPASLATVPSKGGTQAATNSMPAWAKTMMTQFGWGSATELSAMQNLEMSEASWNSKVFNYAGSGAFGIAQALGHGTDATKGSMANQYGGFGLTNAQAQAANSGNAQAQFLWMMNYVKDSYGDPSKAWLFHQKNNWYASGTSSARPGLAMVGERGPELMMMGGGEKILSAHQTSQAVQAPWTTSSHLMSALSGGGSGAGQIHVHIEKGAVQVGTNYQGYNTTSDTIAQATQLTQAIESSMMKSQLLQQLANGVTG